MMNPANNSTKILCEEILAEAHRKGEEIIRHAREQAKSLLVQASADAETVRRDHLNQVRADAARRRELLLATVPVEAGRLRSARIETLLESVLEEVQRRLPVHEGFDYRETILRLATEAVSQMTGDSFMAKLSPEDVEKFGAELGREICQRVGRSSLHITVVEDGTITGGGVVIQDTDGRQLWDNRLAARLDRLWPALRRQVAVLTSLVTAGGPPRGDA
jgi:vacuolar-type H+-ATPase subunit E/Vma4